jgi:hypothetical protein
MQYNPEDNYLMKDLQLWYGHAELFVGRSLMDELTGFPENLVAMQLGALLLSRMVLLDTTAQEILLPCILAPKQGMGKTMMQLIDFAFLLSTDCLSELADETGWKSVFVSANSLMCGKFWEMYTNSTSN